MSAFAGLPWIPKFVYSSGPAVTLTLTYPMRPWTPSTWSNGGGREESKSGLPSVWAGTRLRGLGLRIVFTQAEWPNVRAFLEWAMDGGGSFTFYPDQATAGTSYTVYLIAPTVTDQVQPELQPDGTYELSITVRRTDGVAIDADYFASS